MPLYVFATYTDCREEWAIQADSLEHARELIGSDAAAGDWLHDAVHLDAEAVEGREFVMDDDETPAIEEITPEHWAWRTAHRDAIEFSLKMNIAAISGDFHTHRNHDTFYEAFGEVVDGFVGQYDLCIAMAEALTNWETANGLSEAYDNVGVLWIEVVEDFVETFIEMALDTGALPDPAKILPTIQVLAGSQTAA